MARKPTVDEVADGVVENRGLIVRIIKALGALLKRRRG